jgi:cytochrome c biogenesis protein
MIRKLWDFFCSIRLTLYLLLLLVVFLFLGSAQLTRPLEEFSLLGQMSLFEWLKAIGRKELGISYWIWLSLLCVFFLGLNTVACTIDRLIVIFGIQFRAKTDVNEDFLSRLRYSYTFSTEKPAEEIFTHAKSLLTKHRYRIVEKKTENESVLFGHRGRLSLLGPHLVHLGFIIFLLGHLISFFINQKTYGIRFYQNEPKLITELKDSSLLLENILFEYDPISGRPIDYNSRLSILSGEQKIKEAVVGPNHPLFYQGHVFFQGPYGKEITHLELAFREGKGQPVTSFTVPLEGESPIPGTDMKLGLGQLIPDFYINPQGKISSKSYRMNNPAAPVFIYRQDELIQQGWFFLYNPNFRKLTGEGYNIRLINNVGRTYLEMDMVRNPGAFYALVGSILLMAGLFVGFLSSHRRLWLFCKTGKDETSLCFGGLSSRNKGSFERHLGKLYRQLC